MKTVPYPAFEFSGQPCSVCNRENTVFPSLSLVERGKWSNVCIGCEATNPPKSDASLDRKQEASLVVKVHLTISSTVESDPQGRAQLITQLHALGFVGSNTARFARFGVLTGYMPPEAVERARVLEGVEAAELDHAKYAT